MSEIIFGPLKLSNDIFMIMNTMIHSLMFSCIFLNSCNMSVSTKVIKAKQKAPAYGNKSVDQINIGREDPSLDHKTSRSMYEKDPIDMYRDFLEKTLKDLESATQTDVIDGSISLAEKFHQQSPQTFECLRQLAKQAHEANAKVESDKMASQTDLLSNSQHNMTSQLRKRNSMRDGDSMMLRETSDADIATLEAFDSLMDDDAVDADIAAVTYMLEFPYSEECKDNGRNFLFKGVKNIGKLGGDIFKKIGSLAKLSPRESSVKNLKDPVEASNPETPPQFNFDRRQVIGGGYSALQSPLPALSARSENHTNMNAARHLITEDRSADHLDDRAKNE